MATENRLEEWKDITNYEGLYQISSLGRVRSLDKTVDVCYIGGKPFKRKTKGRILKPYIFSGGFMTVSLYKDGISEDWFVHRLVAFAFLENKKNKKIVSFKDGNKYNISLDNLCWGRVSKSRL